MIENNLPHAKGVHPERLVRDYLKTNPDARPADVMLWLQQSGFDVPLDVLAAILAAMKTG